MLRRAPTTITLTTADIEQYEANRQRKLWEKQQLQEQQMQQQAASSQSTDNSSRAKEPTRSTKDRIMGVSGRGN